MTPVDCWWTKVLPQEGARYLVKLAVAIGATHVVGQWECESITSGRKPSHDCRHIWLIIFNYHVEHISSEKSWRNIYKMFCSYKQNYHGKSHTTLRFLQTSTWSKYRGSMYFLDLFPFKHSHPSSLLHREPGLSHQRYKRYPLVPPNHGEFPPYPSETRGQKKHVFSSFFWTWDILSGETPTSREYRAQLTYHII